MALGTALFTRAHCFPELTLPKVCQALNSQTSACLGALSIRPVGSVIGSAACFNYVCLCEGCESDPPLSSPILSTRIYDHEIPRASWDGDLCMRAPDSLKKAPLGQRDCLGGLQERESSWSGPTEC